MFNIGDRVTLKGGEAIGTIQSLVDIKNNAIQVKWDSREYVYTYCVDFLELIKQ